jgi:tetratricopeptide (TPR) repeat protein
MVPLVRKPQGSSFVVIILALAGAFMLANPGPAAAQAVKPPAADKALPEAPEQLPRVPADRGRGLDFLFGALKVAPDAASAKHVEGRIWALWTATPSDTTMLLMTRAKTAVEKKQVEVAIRLLDKVVRLKPDYVEGWNRRATLHFLQNDYAKSLADIREVLMREPRHFGALTGLGMIMREVGDDRRALDALRKALEINPHLERVPDMVKTLTEKVEGRPI